MPNRNYSNINRTTHTNQLLLNHLNNIKLFGELIKDSNELLVSENNNRNLLSTNRINRTQSNSNPSRRFYDSSLPESRNQNNYQRERDSEIPQFYFSLENLFPLIPNNETPQTAPSTNRNQFTILTITSDNSNVLLNNEDNINEIYDISEYQLLNNPTNDICPITRDSFYNNQNVYMICKCKHVFNKTALHMWLERNDTCPYCRTNIHHN